ncbi:unnamed protein product [Fraxinus pennsylvanica]|uniref:MHD1 domain-containing protein n=1 Tax=Fraxinus pennsylvanica TaxID=56036 RepID=A0AAD2A6N7_9LAMI|nr:unnamed protein product [Fraxinus pennsylvanica]
MATIHLRTSKNEYIADSDDNEIGIFQFFDDTGDIPNPFGDLGLDLSPSELRETAYEVLIGSCRSSGAGRPLTYISSSVRATERSQPMTSSSSPSLQRSLTSSAASKLKKALGLKSSSKKKNEENSESASQGIGNSVKKRAGTVGELMRVQMRVSEQIDSRVRRGLLRVAAGQLGRRVESVVLPLELLQQFRSSDFPSLREYETWQRRILKILEAGLLLHPHMPLAKTEMAPQQLRKIICGAADKPIETGKHSEPMQVLRSVVMSLACRSFDGSVSEICHWADGIPLNIHLYLILLESCFDVNDETSVIEEVDEVLELIKKTWVILGINQILHNICFFWVLFCRYITTSQLEDDLLFASVNMLLEVEKDAKATEDPAYSKILSSTLSYILGWAEKRLLSYHATFYRGNIDVMQSVLSLGASAAKILAEDVSHEYRRKRKEVDVAYGRVDTYIRSSVQNAFSQEKDKVISSRQSTKYQQNPLHVLSILAQNIGELAFNEKEIYSPVLKRWHPLATGVAVVTLHTCYGNELKQFVRGINELTPEAIQVLLSAEKLEKDLVEMAVADSVDSEDGGKAIIQEMIPYDTEAVIANLVKSWIHTRVDRLKQWVDRTLQQEVWDTQSNKGHFAPSAVEVLRILEETLEAFFLLPIPMHPVLLPELVSGLDKCLHSYIIKAKSGCGSRSTFVPNLPALTRCSTGSKLFKKKDSSHMGLWKKSQVSTTTGDGSFSITRLCVRINTLYNIRKELDVLEKRTISNLSNSTFGHDNVGNGKFEDSVAGCIEGIQQLSEATAYKVVFHDLSHVLCDYLYVGEISSSRIEPFLQELEQYLEKVSVTVHDRARTRRKILSFLWICSGPMEMVCQLI